MTPAQLVLLIEDNDDHVELIRRQIEAHSPSVKLRRLRNGGDAISFLQDSASYDVGDATEVSLVMLDLRLPKVGGLEVLRALRSNLRTASTPVVVLTTSDSDGDVHAAYGLGANSYTVKPVDFDRFRQIIRGICSFWLPRQEDRSP